MKKVLLALIGMLSSLTTGQVQTMKKLPALSKELASFKLPDLSLVEALTKSKSESPKPEEEKKLIEKKVEGLLGVLEEKKTGKFEKLEIPKIEFGKFDKEKYNKTVSMIENIVRKDIESLKNFNLKNIADLYKEITDIDLSLLKQASTEKLSEELFKKLAEKIVNLHTMLEKYLQVLAKSMRENLKLHEENLKLQKYLKITLNSVSDISKVNEKNITNLTKDFEIQKEQLIKKLTQEKEEAIKLITEQKDKVLKLKDEEKNKLALDNQNKIKKLEEKHLLEIKKEKENLEQNTNKFMSEISNLKTDHKQKLNEKVKELEDKDKKIKILEEENQKLKNIFKNISENFVNIKKVYDSEDVQKEFEKIKKK